MQINLRYWAHAGRVILTAAPIVFSLLRDFRRFFILGNPRLLSTESHQRRAEKIRHKLEHLGVVFIKIGQVLSSRGDLLPKIYITELSRLQDNVKALPETLVRETLEQEYGRNIAAVFDDFSFKPLATASIGQVHRAKYRGRQIVIKLTRPNIRESLERDSRTAMLVLQFASRLAQFFRLADLATIIGIYQQALSEVFPGMLEETDLARERRNAELMADTLADIPDVIVPKTIGELCTDQVLVLEYCSGIKISHLEELKRHGLDFKQVMNRLVGLYVRMIAIKGVYHADPHPGNIYIRPDGRFVLFDFGIVRTLSEQTRNRLMRLAIAAVEKDLDRVIDSLYELGIIKPSADRIIARQVAVKVTSLHFQGLTSKHRFEEMALVIQNAFQGFPFELPQELVYVFRCLSLLEGLGTRYQPGWNLIADAYPGIRAVLAEYLIKSQGGWWQIVKGFFRNILDLLR